jgi:hypothetical protein
VNFTGEVPAIRKAQSVRGLPGGRPEQFIENRYFPILDKDIRILRVLRASVVKNLFLRVRL